MALGTAFVLALLLLITMSLGLETYLAAVFDFSLVNMISEVIFELLGIGILEIGVMMLLLISLSYWQVMRWNKKLK